MCLGLVTRDRCDGGCIQPGKGVMEDVTRDRCDGACNQE